MRACSWLNSIGLCPSSATNLRGSVVRRERAPDGWSRPVYSMTRSNSLREARRAPDMSANIFDCQPRDTIRCEKRGVAPELGPGCVLSLPEDDNLGLLREEEAGAEDRNAALPGSCVSPKTGRGRAPTQGSGARKWVARERLAKASRGTAKPKPSVLVGGAGAGPHKHQRRGLPRLMRTSPGHDSQPCFCMMRGFCTPQSSLYMTRAEALKKFS